ncbi:MAG: tetratricopeptide repeat protein [Myxococcales bacterium]
MSEPMDPLPPGLEALFEAERPGQHVAPERAERIWKELETAYRSLPPLPAPHAPKLPSSLPKASLAHALAAKQLWAIGAGLLGVGLAAGTVIGRKLTPPATITPPISRPEVKAPEPVVPPPVPAPVVAPVPRGERESPHHRPAPPARVEAPAEPSAPQVVPPRADSDLGAEQALLEIARTALERGKPADGLAALDRHLREFPRGRLAEEREALRVQALAAAGDRDGALKAAESFNRSYPQSLLGPAVREALRQTH